MVLAGAQGVANGENARVKQADDIARPGFVHNGTVLRHQLCAGGQLDVFALLHMEGIHAALKLARANAHKGNAVTVGFVHVGLNFKHECAEILAGGVNRIAGFNIHAGQGRRGEAQKVGQEGLHAKVGKGRAEKYGAQLTAQHGIQIKFFGSAVQQFNVIAQLLVQVRPDQGFQLGAAQLGGHLVYLVHAVGAAIAFKCQNFLAGTVIYALKLFAAADGPVHGVGFDAQHGFNVFHQLKGAARLTVHLIDKGKNGNVAQGAYLEQLDGLGFHALGGVDHHHGAVGGHQCAVGILRKVLVAGGVQNIDALALILKLQHRAGNRDTALLFNIHPVAHRMAGALLAFYRACLIDGTAVQQQLFGECGFTGVGVADNGKCAPTLNLFPQIHRGVVLLTL